MQAEGGQSKRRGFYGWVQHNSHAIHVVIAGLMLVVISLAMVLFGVGMVALVAQVILVIWGILVILVLQSCSCHSEQPPLPCLQRSVVHCCLSCLLAKQARAHNVPCQCSAEHIWHADPLVPPELLGQHGWMGC